MIDIQTKTTISEDDLLLLGSQDIQFEVVNGEIVDMAPTGFIHNVYAKNVLSLLDRFVREHNLGYVATDGLIYVLHVDENGVQETRVPDASFFRRGKFPKFDLSKPIPGAPDLAVEVISPSESVTTIQDKLQSYLTHGTEQIWVIYPAQKQLSQYLHNDPKNIRVYSGDDVLEAETLFPGLKINISEFFVLPDID
jgi:Uma2 family endonuclease